MPRTLLSDECVEYLSATKPQMYQVVDGRRLLSVSSYSICAIDSQDTIELPEYLYSYETLIFCDMNSRMADVIYKAYSNNVDAYGEDHVDFAETIKDFIQRDPSVNASSEGDDWKEILETLGGNAHLIDRVLDPYWKDVRLSRSAQEWIWFIVSSRLSFLLSLNDIIKSYARQKLEKRAPLSSQKSQQSSSASSSKSSQKVPPSSTFVAVSGKSAAESLQPSSVSDVNRRTFYKGGLLHRLKAAAGLGKTIVPSLLSTPPGDFHISTGGLYFSKHWQAAWSYAQMAARFVDGRQQLPVGILSVDIPAELLTNVYTIVGHESRALIWANRGGRFFESQERFAYLDEYDWIQGPVCTQGTDVVTRMESPEEIQLLKFGSETAHQIWTGKGAIWARLQKEAQPSIRVEEIHPRPRNM